VSVSRELARRRIEEARRAGSVDSDIAFDIMVDAIENPTADMLAAGAAALQRAQATASGGYMFEYGRMAGLVWHAMWERID
jgi:hypothetical protein